MKQRKLRGYVLPTIYVLILMIVFGVLTVAASSYLYRSQDSDKALLFVGSSSGIIVDFIGAIFIRPSEHS